MAFIRFFSVMAVILLLTACGFQLRGSERPLHKTFTSVKLVTSGNDHSFYNAVRTELKNARIEVSDVSLNTLEIIESRDQKRTASYSSRAKSAEFELIKHASFRFTREKDLLIAPMKLEARRSYLYRETAAVGKAEEESLLWQEMDQDLAQRILLALQRSADQQYEKSQAQEVAP